jgi:DNA helicase-4
LRELRYVFIDEFQDFSDLFYRLLGSIRHINPRVELFCVGDDWQAINGFAGSDLRFFRDFEKYVGESRQLNISKNYRSSQSIVAIGNALMKGLGQPAIAHMGAVGSVLVADASTFQPSLIEKQRHPGDVITPIASRIVSEALATGSDVVMLSRRNGLPWFVNFKDHGRGENRSISGYLDLVRSLFPQGLKERVSISTAHKYKGLEKPVVIVLDAVARSYPLIHPDWAFSRVLGDNPEKIAQEERRLLYVALTRAIDKLVIVTDGQNRSPFLDELRARLPLPTIDWNDYPAVRSISTRLIVKVGNQDRRGRTPTFAIKDQLKAAGYQYQRQSTKWSGWTKGFPADGFEIKRLQDEVWSGAADGIDVRIYDESEHVIGRFLVDAGHWTCLIDNLASVMSPPDET